MEVIFVLRSVQWRGLQCFYNIPTSIADIVKLSDESGATMAWWHRFFSPKLDYQTPFQLYTEQATRGAEVRVHHDGKAYYIALENSGGTDWKPLGEEVGPYDSAEEAEIAAVNSPWFLGGK